MQRSRAAALCRAIYLTHETARARHTRRPPRAQARGQRRGVGRAAIRRQQPQARPASTGRAAAPRTCAATAAFGTRVSSAARSKFSASCVYPASLAVAAPARAGFRGDRISSSAITHPAPNQKTLPAAFCLRISSVSRRCNSAVLTISLRRAQLSTARA